MTVRTELPADGEAVRRVNLAAFGGPDEARLVDSLRVSRAFIPALSLVAEDEGEVIGHILFTHLGLAGNGEQGDVLALAPLAVLPERQRRGIGSALVRAGLERAADLGFRAVVVVGHPEYYPRFGFLPARYFGLSCPFDVPDDVFMAFPLRPDGLEGVSGTVVYDPAFGAR